MSGDTKTAAAAAAKAQWGDALSSSGKWSALTYFNSADKTVATKWATAAGAFTCTKGDGAKTMTTDCNAALGVATGACCY